MRGWDYNDFMNTPVARANAASIAKQLGNNTDESKPKPKKKKSGPKVSGEIHDEEKLFRMLTERGVPIPVKEHEFCSKFGRDGKPRKFRADYAWLDVGLIVEVQGGAFLRDASGRNAGGHSSSASLVGDWERASLAAAEGWRIVYATPTGIMLPATADLIREAYYGGWQDGTCGCFE